MNRYKLANLSVLAILTLSMFMGAAQVIANNNIDTYQILEQYTPKLSTDDIRPAYIKFQNDTGIYETTNGITTELESFVEAAWVQDYRDYIKRKEESEKRAADKKIFDDTVERMLSIVSVPFAFFFIPIWGAYDLIGTAEELIDSAQTSTMMIQDTVTTFTEEVFDKTIEDFAPPELTGLGSELPQVMMDHGEENDTHTWIGNPTTENTSDGLWILSNQTYQEIDIARAGRTFYNLTEGTYTFQNDDTYYVDNQWYLEDEYPNRFFLRLTNGSLYRPDTVEGINSVIASIDNSTIWGIGYESIQGVMAFYTNFADTDWGHGQYLWYPRLKDGTISAYNQPLYAMYLHLYARIGGTWYDKILNDRSMYNSTTSPRNNLHFYNTSDTFGLYWEANDIDVLSSNWDFRNGFKFNFTDMQFHMINEFRCNSRGFDDIGWGYEITQSPQADGTPYEIDQIRISNGTKEITLNVSEAAQAGTYLDDFYSSIDFISILNSQEYQDPIPAWNETFPYWNGTHWNNHTVEHEYIAGFWLNDTYERTFTFTDMEQAGFTEKYLEVHNQTFPDGSNRYCLLAGMYGYGSYTQGDWILVDPSGSGDADDNEDLYRHYDPAVGYTYYDSSTSAEAGRGPAGAPPEYQLTYYVAGIAIETTINEEMGSVTATTFRVYANTESFSSGTEGVLVRVYNIGGNGGSSTFKENSHSYSLGTQTSETWLSSDFTGSGYKTQNSPDDTDLTDYWGQNRGDSEEWISFLFENYLGDTDEHWNFADSQRGTDYDADISITYNAANTAPEVNIVTPPSANQYSLTDVTVVADYWDDDGRSDLENIYLSLGSTTAGSDTLRLYLDADAGAGTHYWSTTITAVNNNADNYLYGAQVTLSTSVTDGYRATWVVSWKGGYTYYDDGGTGDDNLDTHIYAYDGDAAGSGWDTHNTNGNLEYELILKSLTIHQGDATSLTTAEWFKGGDTLSATGVICFEGATTTYPNVAACDVQMYADNAASSYTDLGETYDDDSLGFGTGVFETEIGWATPTDAGDDTSYQAGVALTDFTEGHTEGSGGITAYVIAQRDSSLPTMSEIVVTGTVGLPGYGSYDDDGVGFSINPSARADTGSGVSIVWYEVGDSTPDAYSSNSDPYVYPVDIGSDGTYTMYGQVEDNVGNLGIVRSDIIYVDETDPSLTSIYFGNEDYDAGTVAWFDQGDTATASMDIAFVETNVYSIVVTCTGGLAPTDGGASATSPFTSTTNINGFGDTSGEVMSVTITDRAGRTDTTFSAVKEDIALDNTAPASFDPFINYDESDLDPNDYKWVFADISTDDFWFNGDEAYDQVPNAWLEFTSDGTTDTGSGFVGIDFGAWGSDDPAADTSAPYLGLYRIYGTETSASLSVVGYDNVGNERTETITITEDNTAPSGGTWTTDTDSDSVGNGISPYWDTYNGYEAFWDDDDVNSYSADASGWSDSAGIQDYRITSTGGSYGSWDNDGSNVACTFVGEGAKDITGQVQDNVANVATADTNIDILFDTTAPTDFDVDFIGISAYTPSVPSYFWMADTTQVTSGDLWYNDGGSSTFTVECDASGTWNAGGEWKVWFGTGFGASPKTDDSAPYDSFVYTSDGFHELSNYIVRIINRNGIHQQLSFPITKDTTNPTLTDTFSAYGESGDTGEMHGIPADDEFWFSNTFDTDGIATFTATGSDGDVGLSGINFGSFGDTGASFDDTSSYQGVYTINDNEVTGSITVTAYDRVGNSASSGSITMTEDATGPVVSITWNFNANDYAVKTGTDFGFDNIDITSAQDTISGLDYGFMYVYDDGGLQSSVKWIVQGLAGSTSDLEYLDEEWYPTDDVESTGVYLADHYDDDDLYARIGFRDMVSNYGLTDRYCKLDRTAPTIGSFNLVLTADTNTGTGYDPNTGYYDDDSVDVTFTGAVTEAGSGLVASPYSYKYDGGSYQAYVAGGDTITSVPDGATTIYVRVIDEVGNLATDLDTVAVEVDTTTPSGAGRAFYSTGGWEYSNYAYMTAPHDTIYFKNDHSSGDAFLHNIENDGSYGNSGHWKILYDVNAVFGAEIEDTAGTFQPKSFNYFGDTGGTNFTVRTLNNAGNYQEFTYETIDDQVAPTSSFYELAESSEYLYWNGTHLFISDAMDDVTQFFTLSINSSDAYLIDESDTVAIYHFEDNVDDALGNYDGTNYGADFVDSFMDFEKALDFVASNTDWVDLGDEDAYSFTSSYGNDDPFSVEMWVNIDAITWNHLIGKYNVYGGAGYGKEWTITQIGTGYIKFAIRDNTTLGYLTVSTTAGAYSAGEWFHLVATYDGSATVGGLALYINGEDVSGTTQDSGDYVGTVNTDADLLIGAGNAGNQDHFNGLIDEVYIFNVELSAAEVGQRYASYFPSGLYSVEFLSTDWGDNAPTADTTYPYERQFEVTSNEDSVTMEMKGRDWVGNLESTVEVIIIDESGQNVELGIGVDEIVEVGSISSNVIINPSFEDGVTNTPYNWTLGYRYDWASRTGSWSMLFVDGNPPTIQQDVVDFPARYLYNFSYWFRGGAVAQNLEITFYYAEGGSDTTYDTAASGSSFVLYYFDQTNLTLDLTKTIDKVRITDTTLLTFSYLDDVSLHHFTVGDSPYLYTPDNTTLYYGDNMYEDQVFYLDLLHVYNGSAGISHVNTTVAWFSESPSASSAPYNLTFDISNTDTQVGVMNITIWTNTGIMANDTVFIIRDIHAAITPTQTWTDENSHQLHYNGTVSNTTGYYGASMSSLQQFLVAGYMYEWGMINPSWEEGQTNWTFSGDADIYNTDPSRARTGNNTLIFSSAGYAQQDIADIPVTAVTEIGMYTLTFSTIGWGIRIIYDDASFDEETFTEINPFSWYYYTVDLSALDQDKVIDEIRIYWIDGTVYMDDIAIIGLTTSGIASLTDDTSFGDNPTYSTENSSWSFAYQIDSADSSSGTFTVTYTLTDNVGNSDTATFSFNLDTTSPSLTYTLTQDPDVLVVNWDDDTTAETIASSLADTVSGYNTTHPVRYKLDSGAWGVWNDTLTKTWVTTEGTRVLWISIHDYCNNTQEYSITIDVDLTDPTIGILTWTNPTYSDNWYTSTDNNADFTVTWTETNPFLVNSTQTTISYEEVDASPAAGTTSFSITITATSEGWYDITFEIWDNAGRFATSTFTADADKLKLDNSVPTTTFELEQHVDRLVDNYYKTLTAYTDLTGSTDTGPSGGAGLPTDFIRYRLNGGSWSSLTSTIYQSWTGIDQNNNTLEVKLIDNVGLESVIYEDWVITDITLPVLGWLTLNESWAPNWYDQDVSTTAQASINWVETYPFDVDATCTLSHTDDNSPSGGNSLINFTITGEVDGSYSVAIRIRDRAGNEDTTLLGSSAPIQLNSGMSGLQIENWFYFYFFRNDGLGLDWRDFNTTYVIDEDYRNYTEERIRGALFAQKYLNLTSTIRFTVRNYFGDVVHNQSYSLPSSFDLYITLDVYTLKVSNIAEEVMNMTIERTGSATLYTEQIMPYEIFAWNMYAAVYNVTIYVDSTDDFGYDPDGNAFNDTQLDLTSNDVARFVDASLRFTQNNMIISEIWQINVITNKDHKTVAPSISVYMNGTLQGGQTYAPGVIIFSRPTYGVYNYTVHGTWQSFSFTYQTTITVESNAVITNFVVAGLEDTNNYLEISWNTNKGTGSLNLRDNTSLVAIYGTEGVSHYRKSTTVGLHMMNFSIAVESRTYLFYANYTIPEWTAIISMSLSGESDLRVPLYESQTISLAVTRSDSGVFNGVVEVNGTSVTITNGAGSVAISAPLTVSDGWAAVNYDITGVLDSIGGSRDYVANDLDVVWDSVLIMLSMSQANAYLAEKTTFSVNATYRYDGTKPSLISFNVYLDDSVVAIVSDSTFDVVFESLGQHKVKVDEVTDEVFLIDYSSGFKALTVNVVRPTGEAAPSDEEGLGVLAGQWSIILILAAAFIAAYYRVIKPSWDSYRNPNPAKAAMSENIRITTGKNQIRMDINSTKGKASGLKRRRTAKGRFS